MSAQDAESGRVPTRAAHEPHELPRDEICRAIIAACPDVDPITGQSFFMLINHPSLGPVPTYGGPFDSYTLCVRDDGPPENDRYFTRYRYDHDEGGWVDGGETVDARVVDNSDFLEAEEVQERVDELEKGLTAIQAAATECGWDGTADSLPAFVRGLRANLDTARDAIKAKHIAQAPAQSAPQVPTLETVKHAMKQAYGSACGTTRALNDWEAAAVAHVALEMLAQRPAQAPVAQWDLGMAEKLTSTYYYGNTSHVFAPGSNGAEMVRRIHEAGLAIGLGAGIAHPSETGARVCDKPGCLAGVVRKDDGARVCAEGHPLRWVAIDSQADVLAELAALREAKEAAERDISEMEYLRQQAVLEAANLQNMVSIERHASSELLKHAAAARCERDTARAALEQAEKRWQRSDEAQYTADRQRLLARAEAAEAQLAKLMEASNWNAISRLDIEHQLKRAEDDGRLDIAAYIRRTELARTAVKGGAHPASAQPAEAPAIAADSRLSSLEKRMETVEKLLTRLP